MPLPAGKTLIPGIVTHSNVMIEHPEVGNDCGFQSTAGNTEIPMSVAWAKLEALGRGAAIASGRLWRG